MASTMPVQLVTSTSLSTAAPAGLMAAPVQWQVSLFPLFQKLFFFPGTEIASINLSFMAFKVSNV